MEAFYTLRWFMVVAIALYLAPLPIGFIIHRLKIDSITNFFYAELDKDITKGLKLRGFSLSETTLFLFTGNISFIFGLIIGGFFLTIPTIFLVIRNGLFLGFTAASPYGFSGIKIKSYKWLIIWLIEAFAVILAITFGISIGYMEIELILNHAVMSNFLAILRPIFITLPFFLAALLIGAIAESLYLRMFFKTQISNLSSAYTELKPFKLNSINTDIDDIRLREGAVSDLKSVYRMAIKGFDDILDVPVPGALEIAQQSNWLVVAKQDKKTIGAGWCYILDDEVLPGGIVVDPAYQRKGIGKQLVKALMRKLKAVDIDEVLILIEPEKSRWHKQFNWILKEKLVRARKVL